MVCSDSMVGFIHKFCSSVFSFTALFSVMQRNGKLDFNVICYLFSVKMILQFSIYYVLNFETAEFFCGHVFCKRCLGTSLKFALSWFKDGAAKTIVFQFQCVTWKLEKLLSVLPYDDLDISEEVREQVTLGHIRQHY